MIELVMTMCLLSEPAKCKDESLVGHDQSLFGCMLGAQPVIAKYMEVKPRWYVKKWRCNIAGQQANI